MSLFLRNAPLVRVVIPFIMGLATALTLGSVRGLGTAFMAIGLLCLLLMASLSKQWAIKGRNHFYGLLSSVLFFSLAYLIGSEATTRSFTKLPGDRLYLATVETVPAEKERSYAVNLKLIASRTDSTTFQTCDAQLVAYFHKESFDTTITPGQSILFEGLFSQESSKLFPREFDYADYLRKKGYHGTVYIPQGKYQLVNYSNFSFKALLNGIRWKIIRQLKNFQASSREFGVIAALILGDRSFLDADLRSDFATAGAVHILAVSGLHVGIIYILFSGLFDFLFKQRGRFFKFIIILLILWAYAGLTGFSPSVLRAATMFSFISLGKYQKKYGSIYNMIAASALVLLIVDPFLITQVGFQLSYLAVLGIVYYHPKFYSLLVFENWILDKAWSLACVSFAAQLATFPLSLYYFNQFPNLFLLTNLVVIPLATFILYSGVAWVAMLWLPFVNDMLGWLTYQFAFALNEFVALINTVSFAKTDELFVNEVQVLLIYLLMAAVTVFIQKPTPKALRLSLFTGVLLLGFHLYNGYISRWQERLAIVKYDEESIAIRMNRGRAEVYSRADFSEKREQFERRSTPYLLSRGVRRNSLSYCLSRPQSVSTKTEWSVHKKPIYHLELREGQIIFSDPHSVDSISLINESFHELRIPATVPTADGQLPQKR